ncbi:MULTISPECIES: hypothetical protein [unclassified Streptomyces]|uniref:hypothetical protein n=1 Tax=unclassified Streptomyces TaxID=2593676 RepID=UPI000B915C51|nr:hypothetical protein [Streptomyces sp. 2R]OXY90512.1 hypothetical protein BEH93_07440 [Streptomyces sp. 2R]
MHQGNDTFNKVTGGHIHGPSIQARDVHGGINVTASADQFQEQMAAALRQIRREEEKQLQDQQEHSERMKMQESRALLGLLLLGFAIVGLGVLFNARQMVMTGGLVTLGVLFLGWDLGKRRGG